ncbi:MAG: hypothetical protein AAGD13_14165 [Pseudomonadota bacterium]
MAISESAAAAARTAVSHTAIAEAAEAAARAARGAASAGDGAELAARATDANRSASAAETSSNAEALCWQAVQDDADALGNGWRYGRFGTTPLWHAGTPRWCRKLWHELGDYLLSADESWQVWIDWYQDRLEGKPANEDLEVAKALIPNEIWEAGPTKLNAEIARLMNEHSDTRLATHKSKIANTLRSAPARVSEAAGLYRDAAKDRIAEIEKRLPGINDPETETELREELTRLRGDMERAKDVADHVASLPVQASEAEIDAATDKTLSFAERVDERVRSFLGKRTTGIGNLLWVGAGSVFLIAIGIPVQFAVPVAGVTLAVGNAGQMAETAAKIADADAKIRAAKSSAETDTD